MSTHLSCEASTDVSKFMTARSKSSRIPILIGNIPALTRFRSLNILDVVFLFSSSPNNHRVTESIVPIPSGRDKKYGYAVNAALTQFRMHPVRVASFTKYESLNDHENDTILFFRFFFFFSPAFLSFSLFTPYYTNTTRHRVILISFSHIKNIFLGTLRRRATVRKAIRRLSRGGDTRRNRA